MLCQGCQKADATISLKQIIFGHQDIVHLCVACANGQGRAINPALILQQMIGEMAPPKRKRRKTAVRACKSCGATWEALKETGRLGCPEDYTVFRDDLLRLLLRVHGSTEHRGRQPARIAARLARERHRAALAAELEQAVHAERFERAATLRDMLQCIEKGEPNDA